MRHNALFLAGLLLIGSFDSVIAAETPDPMEDLRTLEVPEGFEVQLYSADPQIAKPIQMNFDAQGRLWVVSSESYPQLEPGAPPRDKIFILEDADGDGRAETSTVFAEGLMLPTGLEIGDGGVYVGQSTEVLHLRDTDGDGKADDRRIVLSGFGTEDTHHLVHTFRWGPGGNLHFAQSIYIHSHVETPRGVRRLNGGGFWLFRPDSMRLSVLVYGMVNSWGIAFDDFGQSFGVDNDHEESSIKYFLPGARLKHTPGEKHILPGIVMQKPKYCGAEFVTGSHFPDDWQGDFITCDFRAHRVCRYKIVEDGAGYKANELAPIIQSTNIAFRPIDVKIGPDGALYVCDWYNPIINHGEVDFRDPRRDKTHGRIWRVVAKNRPLVQPPKLANASIEDLLNLQASPEDWTRHFARRILAERPAEQVANATRLWVENQSDELLRLRGLWVLETVDQPNRELLVELLRAQDGRVRAAAVRVLSHWLDRIEAPMELLKPLVTDDHPRVRAEAVRTLALFPDPSATAVALRSLTKPTDLFLDYAIKLTAMEMAPHWLPKINDFLATASAEETNHWIYALLAVETPETAPPLLQLWKSGRIPADHEEQVLAAVAQRGDVQSLRTIFDVALQERSSSKQFKLLSSLQQAHRLRGVKPAGDLGPAVGKLLESNSEQVRVKAVNLVAQWKLEPLRAALNGLLNYAEEPLSVRRATIEALADLGGNASVESLSKFAATEENVSLRTAAIASLVRLSPRKAAELAAPMLAQTRQREAARTLLEAFLNHRDGPQALTNSIEKLSLHPDVAREGVQLASSSGQVVPGLIQALTKAGGLPEVPRDIPAAQMSRLVEQVQRQGNAARGEQIYRREQLGCFKCHTIKGQGGKVGPDLSTIGTSAPIDYLIESLLLPSKKIKENFHSTVVATSDGQVFTGIQVRKTEEEIVLRDAEDKQISIPVRDVEATKIGEISLMPAALMDTLGPGEFLDLVRFLSELGKPGPYGPQEELVNRQWYLLGPFTREDAAPIERQLTQATDYRAAAEGWHKSLTTFAGWTYLREFALKPELPIVFANATVEAAKPGKVRLNLEPGTPATLWLNGKQIEPISANENAGAYDVTLQEGANHLLVRIDLKTSPRFLKLTAFALEPDVEFHYAAE